ncbi:GDP-mannose 4,6-dehydratase [Rhodococcus tibetensis]|uniref:GDP-mannose 4,6-dehydratase n=1 Tax=Rhodococcus tibetensis TaxID=2965064 RepID=A0ABT1QGJ6_9NOCA|nr:GDP-mannose 4,6-dehydratase [Rhodococcus sp. FXJ9.536]MCQ4120900.1 GDP-mannose 4,6-dehydratase [Rhodococcus sp. FXJ9.536]
MTPPPVSRALITGICGQDGSYLTDRLLAAGWEVHGISHDCGCPDGCVIGDALGPAPTVHRVDIADTTALSRIVRQVAPTHVFHLAAVSSVGRSWRDPVLTAQVNSLATVALYSTCLDLQEALGRRVVVLNACSGEIFAGSGQSPQNEQTRVAPTSPYGVSKAFGFQMGQVFRVRGLPVSSAILYNHESPRRPDTFVSRKITKAVASIATGRTDTLTLGRIDGRRDWGWAPDYVDCMWRMAAREEPDDYVVATGVAHSIRDFVIAAFSAAGIEDWQSYVRLDDAMVRPTDPTVMVGDAGKAQAVLGWRAAASFDDIVTAMVQHDLGLRPAGRVT